MWGSPLQKGEVPAPFPGTCSEQLFPPFPPLWILVRPLFTTQRKVSKQEGGHTDMWGQGFPAKGKTALRRIAVKWPLKENGDVYLYNWITLLNSKNYYNLVNQLQFNTTSKKWKKKKGFWSWGIEPSRRQHPGSELPHRHEKGKPERLRLNPERHVQLWNSFKTHVDAARINRKSSSIRATWVFTSRVISEQSFNFWALVSSSV